MEFTFKYKKFDYFCINCNFFLLVFYFAWICDDAFITFRYVDNFISGYGLVYNTGERVQGFTHPLWLFLLSFGGILRFDLFYWAIFLGLLFNGLTVFYYAKMTKNNEGFYFGIAFFIIVLYSCSSFVDFQTSGLESSLNHFLLLMITRSVYFSGRDYYYLTD